MQGTVNELGLGDWMPSRRNARAVGGTQNSVRSHRVEAHGVRASILPVDLKVTVGGGTAYYGQCDGVGQR